MRISHGLKKHEKNSFLFKNPSFTRNDPFFLAYYKKQQQGRGLITYDIHTIVRFSEFFFYCYSISFVR